MAELLRIGEVAKALDVSIDTLRRWETEGRVAFVRRGNQRMLPAEDLAALAKTAARPASGSSARNRLNGVVISVERDGVMAKVDMACGEFRIVSLMSREAADELGLSPGVHATAMVKSTSVMIER